MSMIEKIAGELNAHARQVESAIQLLDDGATVPFIARYRKEVTGGLDDTQLRNLEERLHYLRDLEERRNTILNSIEEQGKLDQGLKSEILKADTKARLEDLYLPYKPKRRTKAQIAREAGLEPLALGLLNDPTQNPESTAAPYIEEGKGVNDTKAALEGAKQILMEQFAQDADLVGELRNYLWQQGVLTSELIKNKEKGKEREAAKFSDYFEYSEAIKKIPSHRALALFRGRDEGLLQTKIELDDDQSAFCKSRIASRAGIKEQGRAADTWLQEVVHWTWRVKLYISIDLELKGRLWEMAETEAVKVFADNLRDLLLAAPAGRKAIMGLDPGLRTGVKVAVIDTTAKSVATETIYPHAPKKQWERSIATLAALAKQHKVELISIGNGTASRETEQLASDLMKQHPELNLSKLVVSEAGASVYSASELASKELPGMDVSLRGAVSIARRVQDPLAELVKIDPKSIGVGQYQHDINQVTLGRTLKSVVEDCVNAVGVDLNTASIALLSHVSGLNRTLAENIVAHRDQHGAFSNRKTLKEVSRLGAKTFQQAAGFLRITDGDNPLDCSSVHPEAYPLVKRILQQSEQKIDTLIGDRQALRNFSPQQFVDEQFGLPTVTDILQELEKPGRDPRPEFQSVKFTEGVSTLNHLKPGMILEGQVTNVTNFGAFIDIGVHQDGLVHISALSNRFVKDPREVVKSGEIVKVKVMQIDLERKRVGLSMRLEDNPEQEQAAQKPQTAQQRKTNRPQRAKQTTAPQPQGTMANALAQALKKR